MNKYQKLEKIQEGRYGLVIKARNKDSGNFVAIKKFKEDDSDEEVHKIIAREVRILKLLKHENIIEFKQAFRRRQKVYLVFDYAQTNLLSLIQSCDGLPTDKVKKFIFEALRALDHCHQQNIMHRDIKPQNILVDSKNVLKLCDFGFAKLVTNNQEFTDYVATRWYRPPELLLRKNQYDFSVDVWALGCVLAEMIDSKPLFPGNDDIDQLYLIQRALGPLTTDQQQSLFKDPRFVGQKLPETNVYESLQRRYLGKIQKSAIDLLKRMLQLQPRERISANKALQHPYFVSLRKDYEKINSSTNNLSQAVRKPIFERIVERQKIVKPKLIVRKQQPFMNKLVAVKNTTIHKKQGQPKKREETDERGKSKERRMRAEQDQIWTPAKPKGRVNIIINQNIFNLGKR